MGKSEFIKRDEPLVDESDARLTVLNFDKLIARAKAQYGRVEERRL
jgi:hypothetical protein